MKKRIKVQIITNYFCNFHCEYCYLGDLRKDNKIINIDLLKDNLKEILNYYDIESIGILGGEPTLLKDNLREIRNTVNKICPDLKINIITNLSNDLDLDNVSYATSLNQERDQYQETRLKLLTNNNKDLGLNIVVTPSLLNKPVQELIRELEQYGLNTELIRYSLSENNLIQYNITDNDFSKYLKEVIIEYNKRPRNFNLNNINMPNDCIEKSYSPLMDSVIFITPYNKFAYIKYHNSKENFYSVDTVQEFTDRAREEFNLYYQKCSHCKYKYFNHCYAEHLKLKEECSGLKELLEWYEENIYKNN